MSHIIKIWETVIERRLRLKSNTSENQFRFMLERSTIVDIHILRRVMERFRENIRDLHVVFLGLQKAYDRILREVMRCALEGIQIPLQVMVTKNM